MPAERYMTSHGVQKDFRQRALARAVVGCMGSVQGRDVKEEGGQTTTRQGHYGTRYDETRGELRQWDSCDE